jgi:putative ABC transport system ATP-binding protein
MLIEVNKLWKTYGSGESKVDALRGIDFKIDEGELIAIVGPSGSGKSTFLHMLGAMDVPTKGDVIIKGQNISKLKSKQLTQFRLKNIGFVFQTFNLMPTLSILDNVALPLKLSDVPGKQANIKAKQLLENVGIETHKKRLPSQLSGGQKQRAAIARSLANNPDVILADEPTGNLDSENSEKIMQLFMEMNKKGQTIIIVTHNLELAKRCSRIMTIKDGIIG